MYTPQSTNPQTYDFLNMQKYKNRKIQKYKIEKYHLLKKLYFCKHI